MPTPTNVFRSLGLNIKKQEGGIGGRARGSRQSRMKAPLLYMLLVFKRRLVMWYSGMQILCKMHLTWKVMYFTGVTAWWHCHPPLWCCHGRHGKDRHGKQKLTPSCHIPQTIAAHSAAPTWRSFGPASARPCRWGHLAGWLAGLIIHHCGIVTAGMAKTGTGSRS